MATFKLHLLFMFHVSSSLYSSLLSFYCSYFSLWPACGLIFVTFKFWSAFRIRRRWASFTCSRRVSGWSVRINPVRDNSILPADLPATVRWALSNSVRTVTTVVTGSYRLTTPIRASPLPITIASTLLGSPCSSSARSSLFLFSSCLLCYFE